VATTAVDTSDASDEEVHESLVYSRQPSVIYFRDEEEKRASTCAPDTGDKRDSFFQAPPPSPPPLPPAALSVDYYDNRNVDARVFLYFIFLYQVTMAKLSLAI
jgi:hypothetical protein